MLLVKEGRKWAKPPSYSSVFLHIPGKQSVAGPDKPRTECDPKQPAYSARPSTPRNRRLHGSFMATLAGSL